MDLYSGNRAALPHLAVIGATDSRDMVDVKSCRPLVKSEALEVDYVSAKTKKHGAVSYYNQTTVNRNLVK